MSGWDSSTRRTSSEIYKISIAQNKYLSFKVVDLLFPFLADRQQEGFRAQSRVSSFSQLVRKVGKCEEKNIKAFFFRRNFLLQ